MSDNDYLSEEEQFKEILNNEEISRIKDLNLEISGQSTGIYYIKLFR